MANELSTIAKFIHATAVNDTSAGGVGFNGVLGDLFYSEVIPEGVDVSTLRAMYIHQGTKEVKGAFGFRLYCESKFQIVAVIEGGDFSPLNAVTKAGQTLGLADILDQLFDWANQIDPATGRPTTQVLYTDPDNSNKQLMIMKVIREEPMRYTTFADGVNYCREGGLYCLQYYQMNPIILETIPDEIATNIDSSGSIPDPGVSMIYLFDTTSGSQVQSLFSAKGNNRAYQLTNIGPNNVVINLNGSDTTTTGTSSITIYPGGSITVVSFIQGKWSQIMAFEPNVPTGTRPQVSVTATVTLSLPSQDTEYKVETAAATVITLPQTTGSNVLMIFDLDSLVGALSFTLHGGDAYEGGATLPALVAGAEFALRDMASGIWAIE